VLWENRENACFLTEYSVLINTQCRFIAMVY
jgi:hypothetical protein